MGNGVKSKYFRDKGLLPFQVQFVESFLSEDMPFRELVSPVGSGKTRTAAALIMYEMEVMNYKRILVISPTSLLHQWKTVLTTMLSPASQAITPTIVDRKTYLNLELMVPPGDSPWPISCIILMSIDFAKRQDIASSIMSVVWDLVIFDESHLLRGKKRALFDLLTKSGAARRILLLTSSPFRFQGVVTSQYKYNDIVDWNGQSLFLSNKRQLKAIHYRRTNHEQAFFSEIQEFARRLGTIRSFGKLHEAIVIRNAASSIYAVEGMLRRLRDAWDPVRNRIAHGDISTRTDTFQKIQQQLVTVKDLLGDTDDVLMDVDQSRLGIDLKPGQFLDLFNKLESLLDQIEDIGTDSKMEALISYLHERSKLRKNHICVWTAFVSTSHYLNTSLKEINKPLYLMTSASEPAECQALLKAFRENGGIMIMTDAAIAGVSLEFVDECINYDLPTNKDIFEQRWGRFLRLGRHSEFEMIILKDEASSLPWEEEIVKVVEET